MRLQQLDAVPERVVHVAPVVSGERLVFHGGMTCAIQTTPHCVEIMDEQRRMCLSSRPEAVLHTQMDADRPGFEPRPAPSLEMLRLLDPGHPEQSLVEAGCGVFATGRHGELDVVDPRDTTRRFPPDRIGRIPIPRDRSRHDESTSFGVASPRSNAAMFFAVTDAICSNAFRVKNA